MMETEEKYKVVIVDDERSAIDALRHELEPYRDFEVKGIASNGTKGKKMIMELRPDLLFLDVELPDILGLNLLSEIRDDVLWDMKVVFYTSYDKYLLQALRESAFDFLLKPFESEDLKVIIDRYRKAMSTSSLLPPSSFASSINALLPQHGMFMISTVTGFKLLRLEEIGFFEYLKEKRQWQVVLFNQSRLNLKRNTKAEDIIGYSQAFIQISQSAIVNVNYLAVIDGKCCQLYPPFHDKSDLVISRNFLKELQERFYVL
ncbi:LytTR family DNA-binding domain-containing protein [uncultured Bacteroides sp.]|uniref:LytR/AlgR family response regulator transcription factor n=1 Tax=uncultured Bacteroides sp. TaxID=162156 RepID=UPI0025CBCE9B|nr:LytTR family DNA-binding domain-containing protein [uncultured Bacteroides sp.]